MKNIIIFIFVAALLSGCVSSPPVPEMHEIANAALADYTPFEGDFISDTVIKRALDNNKEILMLRADIEVALEQMNATGDIQNPELRLLYAEDSADSDRYGTLPAALNESRLRHTASEGSGWRAALRFFPANPWERSRRITAVDAALRVKIADLQVAEQQLEISIKRLLAELVYLDKDITLLEQQSGIYKDMLDNINDKMKHGQATVKDLAGASRRYLGTISDRASRERRYRRCRRELAQVIDVPLSVIDIKNMDDNLPVPEPVKIDDGDVQAIALEERPDLIALAWQVAAAESSLKEEAATKIPWFKFFQVSYGAGSDTAQNESFLINNDGTPDYNTRDEGDSTEWRIDAAVNIPIFAWVNSTYDLRKKEYERTKIMRDRSICDAKDDISDAMAVLRETIENYDEIVDCTETIKKSMSDLLPESGNKSVMLSPEMADIRSHILDTARLELAARFDYINAMMDLDECLYVGSGINR